MPVVQSEEPLIFAHIFGGMGRGSEVASHCAAPLGRQSGIWMPHSIMRGVPGGARGFGRLSQTREDDRVRRPVAAFSCSRSERLGLAGEDLWAKIRGDPLG